MNKSVPPGLLRVYRRTRYRVLGPKPFTLRIGKRSGALARWMERTGAAGSVFVTAWNPRGRKAPAGANRKAQGRLKAHIRKGKHPSLRGLGLGTEGWKGEPSFLAAGFSRKESAALGKKFGQNAVVWAGKDAVPRLVLVP